MCGIDADGKPYHVWTWAGNPDNFPYRGMKCDCGLTEYTEYKEKKPSEEETR